MYNTKGTQTYARIGVESAVMGASQPQLLTLLFDGALSALIRARLFMRDGDREGKGRSLSRAINIIDNGLHAGLATDTGDALTDNLIGLYTWMVRRLLEANLYNDVAAVEEVEKLLRGIADAWREACGMPHQPAGTL